jgi:hypothetical protein
MLAMIFLGSLALAKPSPSTVPEGAPVPDEVFLLPAQSWVWVPTGEGSYEARLVRQKSFLLPESMYDTAILKAQRLGRCESLAEELDTQYWDLYDETLDLADRCLEQIQGDAVLQAALESEQARRLAAESQLETYRTRSWVAVGVSSGLVLGATAVIVRSLTR